MIQYSINSQDDRYLFLKGEEEEMKKLTEYLNKIPQYQFLPSYSGIPKPEIHLDFFIHNNQTDPHLSNQVPSSPRPMLLLLL